LAENALWNRNFSLLAIANLISRTGNVVFDVALAWWITEVTGSAKYLGYIMASSTLAVAILSPFCGVLTDRWNKKYILIVTDIISGIVTMVICVLAYLKIMNIPALIVASFILGTSTSITRPTIKSLIPRILKKESFLKANSLTTNIGQTTKMMGPVLAGFLISVTLFGVPGALFFNGISFFISALLEFMMKYENVAAGAKQKNLLADIKEGLKYLYRNRVVRNLLILASVVNIFLASYSILLPLYVKKVLTGSSTLYSNALAVEAAGGFAITVLLLFSKNIKPNTRILALSIGLSGLSLAFVSVFPVQPVLLVCSFLLGFLISGFNSIYFSYIQEVVENELMGRVFSIVYMVAVAVMPISYLMFGYMGNYILKTVFIWSGIAIVISSIPILLMNTGVKNSQLELDD
jgi:DHA3 family macrolide efflux protein-like MFS transporter